MKNKKKIPIVTEVFGSDYNVAASGSLVLPISYAPGLIEIFKESFSAINLTVPETVELMQGEIFYGIDAITEIRLVGYDSALLNEQENNFSEATFQTPREPGLRIVETAHGEKVMPKESERCHFAIYIFEQETDGKKVPAVFLSWNSPQTLDNYDKDIYEELRLTLFFRNSCSLLSTAGFLLETEEGLKFLEDELGKLTVSDLKKMLEPLPPSADSAISKITIQGEFEDLTYRYQVERFAYDIALEYFRTIKFDERVVRDLALKKNWSERRAKAAACVQFAAAMNEYINAALQIYPNFTTEALQIFVKHLIGAGFWKHVLYSVETPAVDFTGKKSEVRDRQIEPLFDDLRSLLKAQKGRPKNSFKKNRRPDKSSAEAIKNAIIAICRTKGEFADEAKITQKEIGQELGVTDRTLRNMIKGSGEDFSILRDGAIREYIGKID
jgi:hypothetical protein